MLDETVHYCGIMTCQYNCWFYRANIKWVKLTRLCDCRHSAKRIVKSLSFRAKSEYEPLELEEKYKTKW